MQWWDRAAEILTAPGTKLKRFGFVTTNSITQEFSRRVIAQHLSPPSQGGDQGVGGEAGGSMPSAKPQPHGAPSRAHLAAPSGEGSEGLSLILAIPDHPWTKTGKDSAAVRIAMTVAEAGAKDGALLEVVREGGLSTDEPEIELSVRRGPINANLTVGADVAAAKALKANDGLACNGMMLAGKGFKIDRKTAAFLLAEDGPSAGTVIRPYLGGAELMQGSRGQSVIDLFGLSEPEARQRYPRSYMHLLEAVKPERDQNRRKAMRERWWVFGEPRRTFRPALASLDRYIATTETTKHRIFQFLPVEVVPDHMIIAIGSDDAFHLGVLSSRLHTEWALKAGGWLGFGNDPRYSKSKVFDPFPFPDASLEQRSQIAELAEELDATRKVALDEVPRLTITEIYNLRNRLASGETLDSAEQDRANRARAGIVNRLHEQIDAAVAEAYGWPADLPPAEIVARLVALNAERAAEEAEGKIRWLRPDYQRPRFGKG